MFNTFNLWLLITVAYYPTLPYKGQIAYSLTWFCYSLPLLFLEQAKKGYCVYWLNYIDVPQESNIFILWDNSSIPYIVETIGRAIDYNLFIFSLE